MKCASVRKKECRADVRRGCWMLKDHRMFGPEPNVTHTASWQQPCHGDVYTNPALLFTIQHSHHRACCKLPLWKFTMRVCVCVCVCGKNRVSVYFCVISLKSRHRYYTYAYTLHQHPAVMHTPHIHSLNSHPALWCVLYYSILPFSKAGTHTHIHSQALMGSLYI